MPDLSKDLMPVARRELTIFYVLDTSGSMTGAPIGKLNRAMNETIEALKSLAKSNADALLKVAVLEFNSGCKWVNASGPEEMEDFMWEDLDAGGLTDVGAALKELDSKLSRNAFLQSMTGAYFPVIIFMTDGCATDDYQKALGAIRKNKWFTRATKIGFALGESPDMKMISEVVGNSEAVIKTEDLDLFGRLIKFASVTVSMLASQSKTSNDVLTGEDVVKKFVDENPEIDEDITPNPSEVEGYTPESDVDDDDGEWGRGDWD